MVAYAGIHGEAAVPYDVLIKLLREELDGALVREAVALQVRCRL